MKRLLALLTIGLALSAGVPNAASAAVSGHAQRTLGPRPRRPRLMLAIFCVRLALGMAAVVPLIWNCLPHPRFVRSQFTAVLGLVL